MDTTELLERLNSCGCHLTAEAETRDELANGVGLALIALGELIKGAAGSDIPSPAAHGLAFKAKSNRW